jgi:hypothetical protein
MAAKTEASLLDGVFRKRFAVPVAVPTLWPASRAKPDLLFQNADQELDGSRCI